jgi:hypothetical protein
MYNLSFLRYALGKERENDNKRIQVEETGAHARRKEGEKKKTNAYLINVRAYESLGHIPETDQESSRLLVGQDLP